MLLKVNATTPYRNIESRLVNKLGHTDTPTAGLIRSIGETAATLKSSPLSLLSVALRLADAGQDHEPLVLINQA